MRSRNFTLTPISATITYDFNGNLTNDGTRSFTWDARNRLTAITSVQSYVYDAVGRRQSVTQGVTTVTNLYDGYDPVQEQSPVGTVSANLQIGLGVDERFTRTKSGVTSTYLTDLLGSTVALADSAGVVQTSYGYDPYGATTQSGAANDNQYQFTGRQNDGTGLYYYRGRYYQPAWGRFINEDPIGLLTGINLYGYANGMPSSIVDPLGLWSVNGSFYWGWGIGATIYGEGGPRDFSLTGFSIQGGFGFQIGMGFDPCAKSPTSPGNFGAALVAEAGAVGPGVMVGGSAEVGWRTKLSPYSDGLAERLEGLRGETYTTPATTWGANVGTKFGIGANLSARVFGSSARPIRFQMF